MILEAHLGTIREVENVRVLRPPLLLDDAAVAAVRRWWHMPMLLNDVAVPVGMTVTVNFTLG